MNNQAKKDKEIEARILSEKCKNKQDLERARKILAKNNHIILI